MTLVKLFLKENAFCVFHQAISPSDFNIITGVITSISSILASYKCNAVLRKLED